MFGIDMPTVISINLVLSKAEFREAVISFSTGVVEF
jgi:hypothetical protein